MRIVGSDEGHRRDGAAEPDHEPELRPRCPGDARGREEGEAHGEEVGERGPGRLPEEHPADAHSRLGLRLGVLRVPGPIALVGGRRSHWVDASDAEAQDQAPRAEQTKEGVRVAPRQHGGAEGARHDKRKRQNHAAPSADAISDVPHGYHSSHRTSERDTEECALCPCWLN